MWFYKNALKNIHEFLADEGVLTEGINKIDYQELLVNQSIGIQLIGISNNFSQSLIKRRLIMMSKSKSQKFKLLKMTSTIITSSSGNKYFIIEISWGPRSHNTL